MTKLDLDRILIGGRERRPVVIVPYDPAWAIRFAHEAEKIASALGPVALGIEHIGSTSVPGLPAKPIVDILVMVHGPENEERYVPPLVAAGYELRVREPEFNEHRMLRTPTRDVHVHMFAPDAPNVLEYRLLREWLKQSPDDRTLYAETKRALARHDWDDMNDYAMAKTDVIHAILERARSAYARGALPSVKA
jgi:GrpB-like predicted nucleotidyltransferase (UPF0157 family)